jgi:hypothetical protein
MSSKETVTPTKYSRQAYFVVHVMILIVCTIGTWLVLLTMASGIVERQQNLERMLTDVTWNLYRDLQSLKEKPGPWGPKTSTGPAGVPGYAATD